MKDFFKKHPELLILIVVVIIIDAVIMWMWMDDTSATEQSRKEIESLRGQAKAINESSYSITNANAKKAQDESEKWEVAFNEGYASKAKNYNLETAYQKGMTPAKAKKIIKDKINYLIDEGLGEKNLTSDRLSFGVYDNDELFSLKPEQREVVFEILAATERLVNICIDADVVSINAIERPTVLNYSVDSSLGLKSYRFILKATNSAEGVKRLMNKIASDEKCYFEINGFMLNAEEQLSSSSEDIRPKIERVSKEKSKDSGDRELMELDKGLRDIDQRSSLDKSSVKLHEESVAPFVDAKVNLELTIDWVQYTKELKK